MKKLAIIGAQRMAKNYAINAREMGVETHCFAWEKGAVAKEYVDYFYPISIFDVDVIYEILKKVRVDGIVSTSELTIPIVAELADRLSLSSLNPRIAKSITDKFRNRKMTEHVSGLYHPKFALVRSIEDAAKSGVGYPCILKPLSEGGKRGVIVVNSEDEINAAFKYTSDESKRQDGYLQEEFLAGGKEYSVESLSSRGKNCIVQITQKITSGPPHCVELGHFQPADLSVELRNQVVDVIDRSLAAVGITEGPCHTEIKIIDGKVYLIEFNARPGGDFISYPLVDLSTGYSYLKGAIRVALNEFEAPLQGALHCSYAGVCFVTKHTPSLASLFDGCEKEDWCWRKNCIGDIKDLTHNDCDNTNYFIWTSNKAVPKEISKHLQMESSQ